MKQMMKIAVVAGVLALATAEGLAQTVVTDAAQDVNIALSGYVQEGEGDATKVRISNKDMVTVLGGASKSKLVLLTPVDYEGAPIFVIRAKNTEDEIADIYYTENYETVSAGDGKTYSVDAHAFYLTETTSFEGQGLTTRSENGAFKTTSVSGIGSIDGLPGVFSGSMSGKKTSDETRTILPEEPAE